MARSSGPRGRSKGNRGRGNFVRKNERIRAREVRLIDPDGKQLGVVEKDEALRVAKAMGYDLVEIAATSRPPVCRIMDFGKYMYEQSKKTKDRTATTSKIKEVKFRVRIEQHDYMVKLRNAETFLYKGNKVKLSLMFRGRENEHKELGVEVINKAAVDLNHVGQAEGSAKLAGRNVNLIVAPLSANRRKLKYTSGEEEEPEPEPDDDES